MQQAQRIVALEASIEASHKEAQQTISALSFQLEQLERGRAHATCELKGGLAAAQAQLSAAQKDRDAALQAAAKQEAQVQALLADLYDARQLCAEAAGTIATLNEQRSRRAEEQEAQTDGAEEELQARLAELEAARRSDRQQVLTLTFECGSLRQQVREVTLRARNAAMQSQEQAIAAAGLHSSAAERVAALTQQSYTLQQQLLRAEELSRRATSKTKEQAAVITELHARAASREAEVEQEGRSLRTELLESEARSGQLQSRLDEALSRAAAAEERLLQVEERDKVHAGEVALLHEALRAAQAVADTYQVLTKGGYAEDTALRESGSSHSLLEATSSTLYQDEAIPDSQQLV